MLDALTHRTLDSCCAGSLRCVQALQAYGEVVMLVITVTWHAEAITAWLDALHQSWLHEASPCWRALCGTCLLSTVDTTVLLLLS